jgi:hypothetical protein
MDKTVYRTNAREQKGFCGDERADMYIATAADDYNTS